MFIIENLFSLRNIVQRVKYAFDIETINTEKHSIIGMHIKICICHEIPIP